MERNGKSAYELYCCKCARWIAECKGTGKYCREVRELMGGYIGQALRDIYAEEAEVREEGI